MALALDLACKAQAPKQRVYNAGSGVVSSAADLARIARELAPKLEVRVVGAPEGDSSKELPLDLSRSKAELGYTPQFPMKKALQDYMEDLWQESSVL